MVNEFKIPIENKRPVETVCELKDQVPSYEEFMKSYKVDENVNYDDLSGGSVGEVKGYGRCKVCDKFPNPQWVEMEMTCPATECSSRDNNNLKKGSKWWHSGCGGYAIISTKAEIKCSKCSEKRHITKWKFKCSLHDGTTNESVNYNSFNKALGWVLQNIENCGPVIRNLGIYMTNHDENDW